MSRRRRDDVEMPGCWQRYQEAALKSKALEGLMIDFLKFKGLA